MTFKWILRRNLDHRRRLAVPWLRHLVRVRNRVSPRDICGGQSGIARGFSPIFRLSRVNIIPRWLSILIYHPVQGLSNCGKCTTSGTPATILWYTGLVRKNQRTKFKNKNKTQTHAHAQKMSSCRKNIVMSDVRVTITFLKAEVQKILLAKLCVCT
jgi:hypothetical protein